MKIIIIIIIIKYYNNNYYYSSSYIHYFIEVKVWFKCDDFLLSKELKCDGRADCRDKKDEAQCHCKYTQILLHT